VGRRVRHPYLDQRTGGRLEGWEVVRLGWSRRPLDERTRAKKKMPKKRRATGARRVSRCRVCGSKDLTLFLDLGETPLANSFLTNPDEREEWFPLQLFFCNLCALVQLSRVVDPDTLFRNYAYRSSSSGTVVAHLLELARFVHANLLGSSKDLVVEIGSNDGTFLKALKEMGVKILGVEPARNMAHIANAQGVETLPTFFGSKEARRIRDLNGGVKVMVANNVFAHVDDLHDFMRGVVTLLDDGGVLSVEVPYLGDLNQNVEYDTVYHEHLSYFTVHPIVKLFDEFGMKLLKVVKLELHGGSIRLLAETTKQRPRPSFLAFEEKCGLTKLRTYESLAERVEYQKESLRRILEDARSGGEKIVGYGAPAKGNTLLNFCGIGTETLAYLIDTTPEKIGRFTPGTHIPVVETERFRNEQPPFALMLAWNYEKEIVMKEREYTGQFIVPIPSPRVLPKNA